jgi:hypothetical protein
VTLAQLLRQPFGFHPRLRRHRRDSAVCGLDDQRGSQSLRDLRPTLEPHVVVCAAREISWTSLAIDAVLRAPLLLERRRFRCREKLLARKLGGPLKRRQRRCRPGTLQVWLTVGRAQRRVVPVHGRGELRGWRAQLR